MKVLWFTSTPSNASTEFGYHAFGGGWISSLETLIADSGMADLGLCFFYNGNEYKKIIKGAVTYHGIPYRPDNGFQRVYSRHFQVLNDENSVYIDSIIDEFQPDLIHVFGTEAGFGKMLMHRKEKVVFHIQGLLSPIAGSFYPPGFDGINTLYRSGINAALRGLTPFHDYKMLKKKSKREDELISYWKYFIGRTGWDKNYIMLQNPDACYFHCEEVLRPEFYDKTWNPPGKPGAGKKIIIGSTINPNIYKGLDVIYNTLENLGLEEIEWRIFGLKEQSIINKVTRSSLKIKNQEFNIRFFGQLNSEDLIKQLSSCHLFVHPSYIDNSSNSVCEAMILGMPVLSSYTGGLGSLIQDRKTGFLFNPHDHFDLPGLINYMVNNYDRALETGRQARIIALRRHNPKEILDSLKGIYSELLSDT